MSRDEYPIVPGQEELLPTSDEDALLGYSILSQLIHNNGTYDELRRTASQYSIPVSDFIRFYDREYDVSLYYALKQTLNFALLYQLLLFDSGAFSSSNLLSRAIYDAASGYLNISILPLLMERHPTLVSKRNSIKNTPLQVAAVEGEFFTCISLLQKGAYWKLDRPTNAYEHRLQLPSSLYLLFENANNCLINEDTDMAESWLDLALVLMTLGARQDVRDKLQNEPGKPKTIIEILADNKQLYESLVKRSYRIDWKHLYMTHIMPALDDDAPLDEWGAKLPVIYPQAMPKIVDGRLVSIDCHDYHGCQTSRPIITPMRRPIGDGAAAAVVGPLSRGLFTMTPSPDQPQTEVHCDDQIVPNIS